MTEERKTWRIPVTWEMNGCIKVEAETLAEAMEIAKDDDGVIPIPTDSSYVDGSWELGMDNPDEIRALYNDNQEDG